MLMRYSATWPTKLLPRFAIETIFNILIVAVDVLIMSLMRVK